jgi:uncharacterized protein YggE
LVAALGASAADARAAAGAASPRTITVAGTGIVTSVPTEGEFTFGVSATAKTATAALAANARAMNKVIGSLKTQGIAAADIQTAAIRLSPNTNESGSTVLDYTATNSVTARIRSLAKAGPIIDGAVRAGANLVSGPVLTSSDQQELSRRALKLAIDDARARAQAIASAAKVRLGRVRSVTEVSTGITLPSTAVAAKSGVSTPVEAGTVRTEADVSVTFDIV